MSTILKALRRLEEDQPGNTESVPKTSASDSSAPSDGTAATSTSAAGAALPATDPGAAGELRARILAEERASQVASAGSSPMSSAPEWARLFGPKATAIGGAMIGILLAGGLAAYWFSPASGPLATVGEAIPIEPQVADTRVSEPVASPKPSTTARIAKASPDPSVAEPRKSAPTLALTPTPTPTPTRSQPEPVRVAVVESRAAANAANAARAFEAADQERPIAAPVTRPTAPSTARPTAPSTALSPAPRRVANRIPEKSSEPIASRPRPTARETAPSVVSSAEPLRRPAAEAVAGRPAAAKPINPPPAVERLTRPDIPAINIVRTAWHPQADRRSARIRFEGSDETLTLREGDAVGALVIKEITPSSVLFETGGIEIRRRIGGLPSR